MLMMSVVEIPVYWLSEAWNWQKLWCLPPSDPASFRKYFLILCLGDEGSADLHRSITVLTIVDWTLVALQSLRAGNLDVCFPRRSGLNSNYNRFDPMKAIPVTVEVAHHGWKRFTPPSAEQGHFGNFPLFFSDYNQASFQNGCCSYCSCGWSYFWLSGWREYWGLITIHQAYPSLRQSLWLEWSFAYVILLCDLSQHFHDSLCAFPCRGRETGHVHSDYTTCAFSNSNTP